MLDRFIYRICEGLDNIIFLIESKCNEGYKNIGSFFNKKRKRKKTKTHVS